MKLLLLSAFCFFSIHVFAQAPRQNPRITDQTDMFKKFKGTNNDTLRKQFQEYLQRKGAGDNLLANKYGNIAILPQDRMPCLIPNTSSIASIPNAWSGTTVPFQPQYHPIPNPALPKQKQSFKWNALDYNLGIQTK
jgi:hypothetical protein